MMAGQCPDLDENDGAAKGPTLFEKWHQYGGIQPRFWMSNTLLPMTAIINTDFKVTVYIKDH